MLKVKDSGNIGHSDELSKCQTNSTCLDGGFFRYLMLHNQKNRLDLCSPSRTLACDLHVSRVPVLEAGLTLHDYQATVSESTLIRLSSRPKSLHSLPLDILPLCESLLLFTVELLFSRPTGDSGRHDKCPLRAKGHTGNDQVVQIIRMFPISSALTRSTYKVRLFD